MPARPGTPVHRPRRRTRARAGMLAALLCAALVAGCSEGDPEKLKNAGSGTSPSATPLPDQDGETVEADDPADFAMDPPDPEEGDSLTADVLIIGEETLPDEVVEGIRNLTVKGQRVVEAALPISVGSAPVDGLTLTVAAVDPGEFRRFTPPESRTADFVWERLAGGEVAVDVAVNKKKLIGKGDMIRLGTADEAPPIHVGAYAPLVERRLGVGESRPAIHAVVNAKRGEQLGIPKDNGLLVSTGSFTPGKFAKQFKKVLGDTATMQTLALEFDVGPQTAVLIGSSVTDAIGTFSYTNGPDGTINPDPAWVKEYIRTEEVPILGDVTCNKAYLPQLRAALQEVVDSGLADKINPEEYAGCYYPRYIGRSAANGLSLHSWGIAVDINVPGNLRGVAGEIDRGVVAIMKKWGMDWGGDWNYTDPMHFEMSSVVRPK